MNYTYNYSTTSNVVTSFALYKAARYLFLSQEVAFQEANDFLWTWLDVYICDMKCQYGVSRSTYEVMLTYIRFKMDTRRQDAHITCQDTGSMKWAAATSTNTNTNANTNIIIQTRICKNPNANNHNSSYLRHSIILAWINSRNHPTVHPIHPCLDLVLLVVLESLFLAVCNVSTHAYANTIRMQKIQK